MVLVSTKGADGDLPPNWNGGTPVNVVLDFLGSLVPNNWTQPTQGDLLLWYLELFEYLNADGLVTINKITLFALSDCGSKICPNLDFSGDGDLSGIGVSLFISL